MRPDAAVRESLLVGDKNLESTHDLREWDTAVRLPVLNGLCAVNEDDEVVVVALVVDLGGSLVSTHGECVCWTLDLVWVAQVVIWTFRS